MKAPVEWERQAGQLLLQVCSVQLHVWFRPHTYSALVTSLRQQAPVKADRFCMDRFDGVSGSDSTGNPVTEVPLTVLESIIRNGVGAFAFIACV